VLKNYHSKAQKKFNNSLFNFQTRKTIIKLIIKIKLSESLYVSAGDEDIAATLECTKCTCFPSKNVENTPTGLHMKVARMNNSYTPTQKKIVITFFDFVNLPEMFTQASPCNTCIND